MYKQLLSTNFMKNPLYILPTFMPLMHLSSSATIRTVNNNKSGPGQFTSFSNAIKATANYDTIYVSGSPNSYGFQSINKILTIIGTGHNPDKQNPLVSSFNYIDCLTGSSGSKFIGITFFSTSVNSVNASYEHCKLFSIYLSMMRAVIGGKEVILNLKDE